MGVSPMPSRFDGSCCLDGESNAVRSLCPGDTMDATTTAQYLTQGGHFDLCDC